MHKPPCTFAHQVVSGVWDLKNKDNKELHNLTSTEREIFGDVDNLVDYLQNLPYTAPELGQGLGSNGIRFWLATYELRLRNDGCIDCDVDGCVCIDKPGCFDNDTELAQVLFDWMPFFSSARTSLALRARTARSC